MPWRDIDESLLRRLEDEMLAERLVSFEIGHEVAALHPRAGGFVGLLRGTPRGAEAVDAALRGDIAALSTFVATLELTSCPGELLHHAALFHRAIARRLEWSSPERAAEAWLRSIAAWAALDVEGTYLASLTEAVVGAQRDAALSGAMTALAELGQQARAAAATLGPPGRAALRALARVEEATTGAPPASVARLRGEATKLRNSAIEIALAPIAEAFEEAGVRGDLPKAASEILQRAVPVWQWTSHDEAVEHFVVDRVATVGWDAYRARDWDVLRGILSPLRPLFESLAARIERDRSNVAYAASAAQMFVFSAELASSRAEKLALAERAVRTCPTHRNGRLVLAGALCEDALEDMRAMFVVSKDRLERIEQTLERAAALFPDVSDLPEARAMLERLKGRRIVV